MSRMRESPRRPLILKRRKLPFQRNDVPHDEPDGLRRKDIVSSSSAQCFPDGIRIMDHPSMPDTQVVVIPKTADLKSVIGALTAKGKECGPQGPNKFILLSGSGSLEEAAESLCQSSLDTPGKSCQGGLISPSLSEECTLTDCLVESKSLTTIKPLNKELDCSPLDDSLTNIQWLGRMSTDGLGPDPLRKSSNKENQESCQQLQPPPRDSDDAVKDPQSERPPYSYMAMIQFAINSKKSRRMTLKEIYTWIEDHFPYFRNVAKPGWKNSIRHNLSLHDMFVRETAQDGKVSYWTIRPEANRCLTLDQVYKPVVDSTTSSSLQTLQVCDSQQQKRGVTELKKTTASVTSERKMKPLLPRTDSYLVPIQLPLASQLFLPSSAQLSLPALQQTCSSYGAGKRVRIAPKVLQSEGPSYMMCMPSLEEVVKEESQSIPVSRETGAGATTHSTSMGRRESSSSRRKQRLVLPSTEEPVLLFPDSTFFDSGLASNNSTFQDTRDAELEQQTQPPPQQQQQPSAEPDSPSREYTFKTPIKSTQPASSTPSKPPATVLPEPWRVTPLGKGGRSVLDFSPIRTPTGPLLTPQRYDNTTFSFSSTPFKELPLFNSPRELLTSARSSTSASTPTCSRELLQMGLPALSNRSLTEGLVLDTMNDSLSKILVDISFSCLDDDELGVGNISWSQFIPDLK
ncbi:forkhead box protein M1 isoform X1 [Alosa sapidissima]|uniref:forkhead box protein M1 isoform X1 n=1 Tax=Alosa sapidissima TaxID=34773 RepID=UPI001C098BD8|nr:forkhead box protein M1 isoform X1 [Alosa sapidissima]XP_041935191.1 forkhead box protein M1 isoform X1 [Alosa sapidissima]